MVEVSYTQVFNELYLETVTFPNGNIQEKYVMELANGNLTYIGINKNKLKIGMTYEDFIKATLYKFKRDLKEKMWNCWNSHQTFSRTVQWRPDNLLPEDLYN